MVCYSYIFPPQIFNPLGGGGLIKYQPKQLCLLCMNKYLSVLSCIKEQKSSIVYSHGKREQRTRLSWPVSQLAGGPPFLPQPTLQKEHSSHWIDHKTHHLTCLCPLGLCPPFSYSKMFIGQSKASHHLWFGSCHLGKNVILEHPLLHQ